MAPLVDVGWAPGFIPPLVLYLSNWAVLVLLLLPLLVVAQISYVRPWELLLT